MSRSKLGLLMAASTLGWFAAATVQADEVAAPAAQGAEVEAPAASPAAAAQAPAPEASAPAEAASAQPASSDTSLGAAGTEPASAAPGDATNAAETLSGGAVAGSETPSDESQKTGPVLGAIGYDSQGRPGRVHIVRRGDTLWDISDAYLGTPWVWPSIWRDNSQVENPHRIYPGDRIWITPSEMRKISAEEAAVLLSNLPPGAPAEPAAAAEVFPNAPAPAPEAAPAQAEQREVHVSARESTGLITPQQYEAAASIVGHVPERVMLSQQDDVYIGAGAGTVSKGDELTVFRTNEPVLDPDTGRMLGYHVDFLGYVEVIETYPETSLATVRMSSGEIEVGDRLIKRQPMPQDVAVQPSPGDVDAKITFFPQSRVVMAMTDFVYLNRGSNDGLVIGSPLEVYRHGYAADDRARDETVHVPDRVIAKLVVVRTSEESSVALVTKSETELRLGDLVRGAANLDGIGQTLASKSQDVVIPVDQERARAAASKGSGGHGGPASRRH